MLHARLLPEVGGLVSRLVRFHMRLPLTSLAALLLLGLSCALRAQVVDEAAARALHERLITLDTHLDTPLSMRRAAWDILQRHDFATDGTQVDLPRMIAGGLDGGWWAVYTAQGPLTPEGRQAARNTALQIALRIHRMVAAHPQHFELALKADDAARIAAAGKRIVYLSMENAYPIGEDISLIRTFYELGVRVMSPVHTQHNDLADSASDAAAKRWNGLSPLGKQFVAECNRLGIVVDASHASDEAFDQMVELSATPILLTHTSCKALCPHPRNIDDERLRRLAARGGVIQMNSVSAFLIDTPANPERNQAMLELRAKYGNRSGLTEEQNQAMLRERREINEKFPVPKATFDDFMKHILHALNLVGPQHVGFGADWDGGGGVVGMEDVSGYHIITTALLKAGYAEKDLAAMWSGNALRLLRTAEEHATKVKADSADGAGRPRRRP